MSYSRARVDALAEIRGIIRGWAFAPEHWIPSMVARAEEALKHVPARYVDDAAELLGGPRKRLPVAGTQLGGGA